MEEYLAFLGNLVSAQTVFLRPCLSMIVSHFIPRKWFFAFSAFSFFKYLFIKILPSQNPVGIVANMENSEMHIGPSFGTCLFPIMISMEAFRFVAVIFLC